MSARALTRIGATGAGAAALCCFTPALPVAVATLGIGALPAAFYSDDVLIPVLIASLAVMALGLILDRVGR